MNEITLPTIWENMSNKWEAKSPDNYFKNQLKISFGNFNNENDMKTKMVEMIRNFQNAVTSLVGNQDGVMFDEPSWQVHLKFLLFYIFRGKKGPFR